MMTIKQAQTEVAQFVISELPDSFSDRKRLLTALSAVISSGHPLVPAISKMLSYLEAHEIQQLSFAQILVKPSRPSRDGDQDGDGTHDGKMKGKK